MHLKTHRRRQDGKEHRYFSVVENRRLRTGEIAQRRVLYLGQINDSQPAAWRMTLEVFDEREQRFVEEGELYVLAKSQGRRANERAIRRRKLARLWQKLRSADEARGVRGAEPEGQRRRPGF
jgi:hypothetical protein